MLIQLNPSIPVNTPDGPGETWFIIDYGPEHDLIWQVALDASGESRGYATHQIRAIKNMSIGRFLNPATNPIKDFLKQLSELNTPTIVSMKEELQERAKKLLEQMK